MSKFKRIYKKYFVFSNLEWERTKAKGFWVFISKYGILRIGIFCGILVLFASYLQDLNFKIQKLSLTEFVINYFVNIPYTILAGCFISIVVWIISVEN